MGWVTEGRVRSAPTGQGMARTAQHAKDKEMQVEIAGV